jgi:uncharacterized repeat protein (TIGR03847 family)
MEWVSSDNDSISAVAVGPPGKRSFFIAIRGPGQWLRVWLEKHDLLTITLAARELMLNLSINPADLVLPAPKEQPAPSGLPAAELELREAQLGYQEGRVEIILTAERVGPGNDAPSSLRLRPDMPHLAEFMIEAERVCTSGRPICPLCGGPIDPSGHTCPRQD